MHCNFETSSQAIPLCAYSPEMCFVCTSPSEVLLGVSQRLGMSAPERAVAI